MLSSVHCRWMSFSTALFNICCEIEIVFFDVTPLFDHLNYYYKLGFIGAVWSLVILDVIMIFQYTFRDSFQDRKGYWEFPGMPFLLSFHMCSFLVSMRPGIETASAIRDYITMCCRFYPRTLLCLVLARLKTSICLYPLFLIFFVFDFIQFA